jgi:NAD(P)-dependent dehydrogenase (short-subunit alcohol dehydrogenase family)
MDSERTITGFGAQSTAAEVIAGIDLTGRRAIVTGGASGIGVETARALAGANAEVTLAVRNLEAGERSAADISASTGNSRVLAAPLDLADPAAAARLWQDSINPLSASSRNSGRDRCR